MTAQYKNSAGRWVAAPRPQKAIRWKARVYVRGHDGVRQEIMRFGRTRREAAPWGRRWRPSFVEQMPSSARPCRWRRVSAG